LRYAPNNNERGVLRGVSSASRSGEALTLVAWRPKSGSIVDAMHLQSLHAFNFPSIAMPTLPLSRTSLVSLVCPSTPFLALRLLSTPAYLASLPTQWSTPFASLQRASYARPAAKQSKKPKKLQPFYKAKDSKGRAADEHDPLLRQLRSACQGIDVKTLLDLYPTLVATRVLNSQDTRRICQAIHARVRNMALSNLTMADILVFVQRLASDIQTGVLPPHPYAHVHLLGIYKECEQYQEGYAFWQWLVDQDETFVSQAVYGAAIELMAYGGILPLAELELIYTDGLKRFPGTFAEYHLSPNAIVPDRSQPTVISDIPVLLLQGILTARILARDWCNAYLALDTVLRLFPTQVPTRYFELFMSERPLAEAYTVFLVACRAGVIFKPSHLTGLIKKLRMGLTNASLYERVMGLRAVANLIYAYLEAGGTFQPMHSGAFIRAFEILFPNGGKEDYSGEDAKIRNVIVSAAHEFMSTFLQAGLPPQVEVFTALIHLAGKYRVPSLLQAALNDIKIAQLELDEVHRRIILEAAGRLGDKELIGEYWTRIATHAETEGKHPDHSDWMTLVRACNRGAHTDYFEEQVLKYDHTLSDALKSRLTYHADMSEPVKGMPEKDMDYTAFTAEIDAIRDQVKNIAAVIMAGQPLDLRKTPFYMSLDSRRKPLGSLEDLRTIYNELTTDPYQPAPPSGALSLSSTGIPLDELRFQNWVSIHEMMYQAHFHEDYRLKSILHPENKVKMPFGGAPQEGLPMELESLRTTIQKLRSSSFNVRKVLAFPGPLKIKKKYFESNQPTSSPTSSDSGQDSERPSLSGHPYIDQTVELPPPSRAVIGENLPKSPTLRYYIGLETHHDAPATMGRRLKSRKSANRPLQHQETKQDSSDLRGTASVAESNVNEDMESMQSINSSTS
jgi:hypothetical protein